MSDSLSRSSSLSAGAPLIIQPTLPLSQSVEEVSTSSRPSAASPSSCVNLQQEPFSQGSQLTVLHKGRRVTPFHLQPDKRLPTHSRLSTQKDIIAAVCDTYSACKIRVQKKFEGENPTASCMYTIVSYQTICDAYKNECVSFGWQFPVPQSPVRPYLLFEWDRDMDEKDVSFVIQTLANISSVFNDTASEEHGISQLEWSRWRGMPTKFDRDRLLLVFDNGQHFPSFTQYVQFFRSIQKDFEAYGLRKPADSDWIPFPGSVEPELLALIGEDGMKELDGMRIGWQLPDDTLPELARMEDIRKYSPFYIPNDSEAVINAPGPRLQPVGVEEMRREGTRRRPPGCDLILEALLKKDRNFKYEDMGFVQRAGEVLKFSTKGIYPWTCPCNVRHSRGWIEAHYDTDGVAVLDCRGTEEVPACAPAYLFATPSAEEKWRWMQTFTFLTKHHLDRPDFPIFKRTCSMYGRENLRTFFRRLDPDWNFDTCYGYHPEPPPDQTGECWSHDLIKELQELDSSGKLVLHYLNLFIALIKGLNKIIKRTNLYDMTYHSSADMKNSTMTNVFHYVIDPNSRSGKKKESLYFVEWNKWTGRREFANTITAPLLLARFTKEYDRPDKNCCNLLRLAEVDQDACLQCLASDPEAGWVRWMVDTAITFWVGKDVSPAQITRNKQFLRNWVGRVLCQIARPAGVMPILWNKEASLGKSTLGKLLIAALGTSHTCQTNPTAYLTEGFNDDLVVPFVFFDEGEIGSKSKESDTEKMISSLMKAELATDMPKQTKVKYGSNKNDRVRITSYLLTSNGGNFAGLSHVGTERRLFICETLNGAEQDAALKANRYRCKCPEYAQGTPCKHSPVDHKDFWDSAWYEGLIKNHFRSLIGVFIEDQRSIGVDLTTPLWTMVPQTMALHAQKARSRHPVYKLFQGWVKRKRMFMNHDPKITSSKIQFFLPVDTVPRENESYWFDWIGVETVRRLMSSESPDIRKMDDATFEDGLREILTDLFPRENILQPSTAEMNCRIWSILYRPVSNGDEDAQAQQWRPTDDILSFRCVHLPLVAPKHPVIAPSPYADILRRSSSLCQIPAVDVAAQVLTTGFVLPGGGALETPSRDGGNNSDSRLAPYESPDHEDDNGDGEPDNGSPINSRRALLEDMDENAQHADDPSSYEEDSWLEKDVPGNKKKRGRKDTERDANSSPSKVPKDKEEADEVVIIE